MAFFEGGGGNGSVVRVNPSRPQAAARAAYSPPPPRVISQAPTPAAGVVGRLAHAIAGVGAAAGDAANTTGRRVAAAPSAVANQARRDWLLMKANGILPPGAAFPSFALDPHNTGAPAYTVGRTIHMSPQFVQALLGGKGQQNVWARQGLVHEMAHTMQNSATLGDRSLAEGGAQTFADIAGPKVVENFPKQDLGYNALGLGATDSNYAPYVAGSLVREPRSWIMRGQFTPGASAPTINAPGTKAFAGSASRLGSFAGAMVDNAANRPALWRKYHPNG